MKLVDLGGAVGIVGLFVEIVRLEDLAGSGYFYHRSFLFLICGGAG